MAILAMRPEGILPSGVSYSFSSLAFTPERSTEKKKQKHAGGTPAGREGKMPSPRRHAPTSSATSRTIFTHRASRPVSPWTVSMSLR